MNITTKQTDNGFYLTATFKGCKYGQTYDTTTEAQAREKFRALVYKQHKEAEEVKAYWKAVREEEAKALTALTLEDYLEQLTNNNWHTLRQLIEWQLGLSETNQKEEVTYRAYLSARTLINA